MRVVLLSFLGWVLVGASLPLLFATELDDQQSVFAKQNLVAWCIVPFDAKRRSPLERAEMIKRLGLQRVAYDWRDEHVPTFEQEILAYKQHGIEYFAFWSWHDAMEPLIKKHGIQPQIWITNPSPGAPSQQERVEAAAKQLLPMVRKTRDLGLKLGLYNHGGWGGEPENLVAVCEYLHKSHDGGHVGIVYNFHHGHGHIEDFATALKQMQPYLLCLNLNGMVDASAVNESGGSKKILPLGAGGHETKMMQAVGESGYRGAVGILDHRNELDAERSLQQNLDGLKQVLRALGDEAARKSY